MNSSETATSYYSRVCFRNTLPGLLALLCSGALFGCSMVGPKSSSPVNESEYLFGATSTLRTEGVRYPAQSAMVYSAVAGHLRQGRGGIADAVRYFDEVSRLQHELMPDAAPILSLELTRADLWLQLGRRRRALAALDHLVSSTNSPTTLSFNDALLRAHLLLETGDASGARDAYKQLLSPTSTAVPPNADQSDEVRAFHRLAEFQAGDRSAAYFSSFGCDLRAGVFESLVCGRIAEELGLLSEALLFTRRSISLAPELRSLVLDELRILLKQGRTEEVLQRLMKTADRGGEARDLKPMLQAATKANSAGLLREIVKNAPGGVATGDLRAKLAARDLRAGRPAHALRQISLVLAAEPKNDSARLLRASLFSAAGRRVEARSDLLAIEPKQGSYVQARLLAAQIGRFDGDLEQATQDLRPAAMKKNPDRLATLSYLSLLREQGKLADALTFVEQLEARQPSSESSEISWMAIERVHLLKELERDEEALEFALSLLKRNEHEPQVLNFIAYEFAERYSEMRQGIVLGAPVEDLALAEELARRAVQLSPDEPYYLDTLGWVLYQRKNFGAAVVELRRAYELLPNDLAIAEHFGDALEAQLSGSGIPIYIDALEKAQDRERGMAGIERLSSDERAIRDRLQRKIQEHSPKGNVGI